MLSSPKDFAWPGLREAAAAPRDSYEELGAAPVGEVLDPAELEQVRAAFEALVEEHGVVGPYASIVHDAWRKSDVLASFVPRLGADACRAIGVDELVLFHDHLLSKPSGGDDMAWHQDFSYLPLDRPDGVTFWIALDDITEDNGCLYYVFGSHRLGERRAAWGLQGDDDPRAALPPLDVPDDQPGLPAPTGAGCAVAHHVYLWHRSPRNTSPRPRRSWALSFVGPEVRWSPLHAPHPRSVMSSRGEGEALEDDLLRVRR
jgi:ectoine hydroxylase-related dioxygenase (phytanoyl-CoA dioxygenase family)